MRNVNTNQPKKFRAKDTSTHNVSTSSFPRLLNKSLVGGVMGWIAACLFVGCTEKIAMEIIIFVVFSIAKNVTGE